MDSRVYSVGACAHVTKRKTVTYVQGINPLKPTVATWVQL